VKGDCLAGLNKDQNRALNPEANMSFSRRVLLIPLAICSTALLAGCWDSVKWNPALTSISITTPSATAFTLQYGTSAQLVTVATYNDGSRQGDTRVTYHLSGVSPAGCLTVSGATISAVTANCTGGGTGMVYATDDVTNLPSQNVAVTVTAPPPSLVSIAIDGANPRGLVSGQSAALTVTGTYSNATTSADAGVTYAFAAGSPSPAGSITLAGAQVTAVSAGTAQVIATDTASGIHSSPLTINSTTPPVATNVLSTGFNSDGTTTTSTPGNSGSFVAYAGGQNNPANGSGGNYVNNGANPSDVYIYTNDTLANLAGFTYQGITIKPAANQVVSSSGYNALSFTLGVNPEWFASGPANFVVLISASVTGVSTGPGGNPANCNPTAAAVVTATASAASVYTVPLSAFNFVAQNCGVSSVTAAQIVAAPVVAVDFQADGGGAALTASGLTSTANRTVAAAGSNPAVFPTTIDVSGSVSFATAQVNPPPTTNVLSTGFNSNGTTNTSVTSQKGSFATYAGGQNNPANGNGGGYVDQNVNPSYEYIYISDIAANLAGYTYQGVTVSAAAAQTVSASGHTMLSFTVGVNPEWFASGPANFVVLVTSSVAGVSTGPGGNPANCNPTAAAVVTATSSNATAYSVPLSEFTKVAQDCGVGTVTTAQILAAPVLAVDFQADGGGAALTASGKTSTSNTTVATSGSSPAVYPTTISVVDGVSFQ
jgi:hypothetical protein